MKGPDPRRAPRGLGSSQPPSGRLRHEGFSARGARGDEDGTTGEAPPRRPERGGPRPLPALSTHTGRRGGDERDPVRARRAPIRTPPSAARGPPHTPTPRPTHASPRPPNPNPDARGNPPFPARDHMRAPIPNPPTGRRWVPQGTDGKRRGGVGRVHTRARGREGKRRAVSGGGTERRTGRRRADESDDVRRARPGRAESTAERLHLGGRRAPSPREGEALRGDLQPRGTPGGRTRRARLIVKRRSDRRSPGRNPGPQVRSKCR